MAPGPRIVLYTGKGGVGKTSVAAATARRLAADGRRVLVLSTDPAHSLADVLGRPIGAEPTAVAERLDGLQVDPQAELTRHWSAVRAWAGRSLVGRGVDRISAQELTVPPGLEELLALLRIVELRDRGDHDAIVVDCAPAGETLRLLAFPEIARWWLDRIVPRQGELLGAARPLARAVLDITVPDGEVLDELGRLMANLLAMRELLCDGDALSVRLVTTADRIVVDEARRTYTYLSLHGIATDAIVVNRLFPADVGAYFAGWRDRQQALLEEIDAAFAPLPVLRAPYYDAEVIGDAALDRLAAALYPDHDPAARLHPGHGRELVVEGDVARLRIAVGLAERGEVGLRRSGDELVVEVAGRRRTVLLPDPIAHYRPHEATLRDGTLEVTLRAPVAAER
ncbi:ArsA family ATPase [Patulibacter brassicae]|uniref:ArsA family ATPase n=1 Tax=Patulibacter brassicae TaxID=1705717 RepID=A0ABU4VMQ3_9ACTN|nr:ArsA family ATPase [Patulibacter brassicae]MDX8153083.1 ArsA family ATPase [Patulibacter brassicae]